jgi:hypothetical protein
MLKLRKVFVRSIQVTLMLSLLLVFQVLQGCSIEPANTKAEIPEENFFDNTTTEKNEGNKVVEKPTTENDVVESKFTGEMLVGSWMLGQDGKIGIIFHKDYTFDCISLNQDNFDFANVIASYFDNKSNENLSKESKSDMYIRYSGLWEIEDYNSSEYNNMKMDFPRKLLTIHISKQYTKNNSIDVEKISYLKVHEPSTYTSKELKPMPKLQLNENYYFKISDSEDMWQKYLQK